MKLYKKLLLAAALVVVVGGCYAAYRVHQVQASYYAMAGEVTVMDKFESGTENYIVHQGEVHSIQSHADP